jgi:hypothetical protein
MADEMPVPDLGPAPAPWGKVPEPKKDPIFGPGKDKGQADDVFLGKMPVDWSNVAVALQQKAEPFYDWIVGGARGPLSQPAQVSIKEFANWVKTPLQGKENWATEERWPEIAKAIASNSDNSKLLSYLLSL